MRLRFRKLVYISVMFAGLSAVSALYADPVQLYSNQLTPVQEADTFQTNVLENAPEPVNFVPVDGQNVTFGQGADLAARYGAQIVFGGLYPDFVRLKRKGILTNLDSLWQRLSDRKFEIGLRTMARLQDSDEYFVPWMQATYLMVANKKALQYLPKGASLDTLTYAQLEQWAKSIYEATGQAKLGFPAGEHGLMYRFLEGYLEPSFVDNLSNAFAGAEAATMWSYLRSLWQYVAPSSIIFSRMDQALLNGNVWIAWDHTARLIEVARSAPQDFVAFPAPIGPKGRGYLRILVGLAVPKGGGGAQSKDLIAYLTSQRVQGQLLEQLGFLPVLTDLSAAAIPKSLKDFATAGRLQMDSAQSVPAPQLELNGSQSTRFNYIFLDTFSRIVLNNQSLSSVLPAAEASLAQLLAAQAKAGSSR